MLRLEYECAEVKSRVGVSRNDSPGGHSSRSRKNDKTLENIRFRKETHVSLPQGRTRELSFCEHLPGISFIRQCGIFWFQLWSPRTLQSIEETDT